MVPLYFEIHGIADKFKGLFKDRSYVPNLGAQLFDVARQCVDKASAWTRLSLSQGPISTTLSSQPEARRLARPLAWSRTGVSSGNGRVSPGR